MQLRHERIKGVAAVACEWYPQSSRAVSAWYCGGNPGLRHSVGVPIGVGRLSCYPAGAGLTARALSGLSISPIAARFACFSTNI